MKLFSTVATAIQNKMLWGSWRDINNFGEELKSKQFFSRLLDVIEFCPYINRKQKNSCKSKSNFVFLIIEYQRCTLQALFTSRNTVQEMILYAKN